MSVLIKGLEMPKGCAFCWIGKRNGKKMVCPLCDEEWDIHDPMSADHRLDNCPLRPVPPHGRLGDLDALKAKAIERSEKCGEMVNVLDKVITAYDISTAPTVIPAEPDEDPEEEESDVL